MSDLITAPATLFVSNLTDGGQNWRMSTQDIPMELKLKATELHGQFGWAVFSPNPLQEKDLPKGAAKDKRLTPSQKLRYVILSRAEHQGVEHENREDFYFKEMDRIIQREMKGEA